MANTEHLSILEQGIAVWNQWREENPEVGADLRGANLRGPNLRGVDLSWANLSGVDLSRANLRGMDLSGVDFQGANLSDAKLLRANLRGANLRGADLQRANLRGMDLSGADLSRVNLQGANLSVVNLSKANLSGANLSGVDLSRANLSRANLRGADLSEANLRGLDLSGMDLSGADLSGADLTGTYLVRTQLKHTILTDCRIYGVSAWSIKLEETTQKDLIITPLDEPKITVDDLRIAQFIYLLLDNKQIRDVLDTITAKAVLILGRFTDERKAVLDALREELRQAGYLPILFDFDKPASRDLTETIMTLASLSRFIIADVTDAKSIPQELKAIVPNLPSVPVQLLIQRGAKEYALLEHIKRFPWVIDTYEYKDTPQLMASLADEVIKPAEAKAEEQRQK